MSLLKLLPKEIEDIIMDTKEEMEQADIEEFEEVLEELVEEMGITEEPEYLSRYDREENIYGFDIAIGPCDNYEGFSHIVSDSKWIMNCNHSIKEYTEMSSYNQRYLNRYIIGYTIREYLSMFIRYEGEDIREVLEECCLEEHIISNVEENIRFIGNVIFTWKECVEEYDEEPEEHTDEDYIKWIENCRKIIHLIELEWVKEYITEEMSYEY